VPVLDDRPSTRLATAAHEMLVEGDGHSGDRRILTDAVVAEALGDLGWR
jgi:hypothetical protein